ncbi:cytochrome P450 family protein [Planosporangium mesophilum]|nr:cytochrome P450 [Planosporangium mesophilum]
MREEGPVHRVTLPDGATVWLVTRYADVRQALADPRLSLDKRHARGGWRGFSLPAALDANLLNMDPPDHTRIRRLVGLAFTPRRVEALRPRIRQTADALVDGVATRIADDGVADLVAGYATPLPIAVICDLLGVPAEDRTDFRGWTDTMLATYAEPTAVRAAIENMRAFLARLLADKRHTPGDDLLSALISARDSAPTQTREDRLTEDELTSLAFLILFAGHETSVNLIGVIAAHLLTCDRDRQRVRRDPGALPALVEELLRVQPPAPLAIRRFAREDVTIGDATTGDPTNGSITIPAGDTVVLALASANRDPARFTDPTAVDLDRPDNAHLALGHGVHYCLGAALARVEAHVATEVLFGRLPGLALALPVEDVAWRPTFRTRGPVQLPVTY